MTAANLTKEEIVLKEMCTPEFFVLLDRESIISPTEGTTEVTEQDVLRDFYEYLKLFGGIGEHAVCSEAGCKSIEGFDEFWRDHRKFDELIYLGKMYFTPPTNKGLVVARIYKLEKFRSVDYSEAETDLAEIANYIKLNYYTNNLRLDSEGSNKGIGPKNPVVMGNILDVACYTNSGDVNRITSGKTIPNTLLKYTEVYNIYNTEEMFQTENTKATFQFGGIVDIDDNSGWKLILKFKANGDKIPSVGTIGASVAKLYENGYKLPIGMLLNVLANDAEYSGEPLGKDKANTLRKITRSKIAYGSQQINFTLANMLVIDVNMLFNDNEIETEHRVQISIINESQTSGLELSVCVDGELIVSDAIVNINKKRFVFDHDNENTGYELEVVYANWGYNEE